MPIVTVTMELEFPERVTLDWVQNVINDQLSDKEFLNSFSTKWEPSSSDVLAIQAMAHEMLDDFGRDPATLTIIAGCMSISVAAVRAALQPPVVLDPPAI